MSAVDLRIWYLAMLHSRPHSIADLLNDCKFADHIFYSSTYRLADATVFIAESRKPVNHRMY